MTDRNTRRDLSQKTSQQFHASEAVKSLFMVVTLEQYNDAEAELVKKQCASTIRFLSERFPTLTIGACAMKLIDLSPEDGDCVMANVT